MPPPHHIAYQELLIAAETSVSEPSQRNDPLAGSLARLFYRRECVPLDGTKLAQLFFSFAHAWALKKQKSKGVSPTA